MVQRIRALLFTIAFCSCTVSGKPQFIVPSINNHENVGQDQLLGNETEKITTRPKLDLNNLEENPYFRKLFTEFLVSYTEKENNVQTTNTSKPVEPEISYQQKPQFVATSTTRPAIQHHQFETTLTPQVQTNFVYVKIPHEAHVTSQPQQQRQANSQNVARKRIVSPGTSYNNKGQRIQQRRRPKPTDQQTKDNQLSTVSSSPFGLGVRSNQHEPTISPTPPSHTSTESIGQPQDPHLVTLIKTGISTQIRADAPQTSIKPKTVATIDQKTPRTAVVQNTQALEPQIVENAVSEFNEDEFRKQAESAKYEFASEIEDNINDNVQVREEIRDGPAVKGKYSFSDGYHMRTVHYEADDKGYRVVKQEVAPLNGPQINLDGHAKVSTYVDGNSVVNYQITQDDVQPRRKVIFTEIPSPAEHSSHETTEIEE